MDHVALGMPTLVLHIAIDLHELLEDRAITPNALRREPSGIVKVAVNVAVVLIIRVLRTEESGANRARKMLDMKLLV